VVVDQTTAPSRRHQLGPLRVDRSPDR